MFTEVGNLGQSATSMPKQEWRLVPDIPSSCAPQIVILTFAQAYGLQLLTKFGGMTIEEAKHLFQNAFKDLTARKVHGYEYCWQVYARKPE